MYSKESIEEFKERRAYPAFFHSRRDLSLTYINISLNEFNSFA